MCFGVVTHSSAMPLSAWQLAQLGDRATDMGWRVVPLFELITFPRGDKRHGRRRAEGLEESRLASAVAAGTSEEPASAKRSCRPKRLLSGALRSRVRSLAGARTRLREAFNGGHQRTLQIR